MKFSQADFLIFSRVTFYCSRVNILKFQGIFFIFDREINFFVWAQNFFSCEICFFFAGRIFCPRAVFKNFSWEVTILLEQKIENFLMINFFLPGKTKHCPPEGDRERRS